MRKENYLFFFICLAFLLGFIVYSFYQNSEYEWVKRKGRITIGEVEVTGLHLKVKYKIRNILYTSKKVRIPYVGIISGEKFELKYNENDKDNYYINYAKPYLDPKSTCFSNKVDIYYDDCCAIFSYNVEGKAYNRVQVIEPKYLDMLKREEKKVILKYDCNEPNYAYVFIPQ